MNWRISTLILVCAVSLQARAQGVSVMAAGSLKDALTEVAAQFEARSGTRVSLTFGPSGLLRQRLEQGSADASAQAVSCLLYTSDAADDHH
jgi:molybdate transport system substrate-binding protein